MNKVLHVLVYVFLALAGAALFFELQLNAKRSELTDRNRMQEDYLVKIARTVEKADPAKDAAFEIKKDTSPVEARLVDSPDMENVLADYSAPLEQTNLDTYNWDGSRDQLRQVYVLDAEGKPVMDGNQPQTRDSGEYKLLEQLFNSAKNQQSRLNSTRAALAELRGKLESVVAELNKLKPEARQDKVTIEEQKAKMAKLEEEKAGVENQLTKTKAQVDELNGEITSLKDEVSTAKDASAGGGAAVTSLPAGDKGKIVQADNENMFAIVEFTEEAMKELKGNDPSRPLPALELGVKRSGHSGAAGEFVGRVRLRQEVKGKTLVICDILSAWEQDKLKANDVIFAD